MSGNKWYSYPKNYSYHRPRREFPLWIIVLLYLAAIAGSVIVLVR